MSYNNKVVLVTGASSGIGAAIAIKFASEGANCAIVGRNERKLKNVSDTCRRSGKEPLTIVADMTNDDDIKRIVSATINRFEKLDVLVNNAGIIGISSIIAENALQIFDKVMATNLRSIVYLTNLAVPHLIATKGNIINISSVASQKVFSPQTFVYATSKAGLDHFTRCIALELAPKGIRVNVVNPGPVKTDFLKNHGINKEEEGTDWEMMKNGTALKKLSEPAEVADLVAYLTSDKARSITGASFVIDNGMLLNS